MTVIITHTDGVTLVRAKVFIYGTLSAPKIELEYTHDGMSHSRTITKEQAYSIGITNDSQPFKQLIACQAI